MLLTLLEPVCFPPTLPPGFGSLDAPCSGQEAPCSARQGSWTHRAGEEPVDIMFLPRNGKVGMFLGKEQRSGASTPGTSTPPSLLPGASPAVPDPKGREARCRGCWVPGTSVHTHRVEGLHIYKSPHSPTHTWSDTQPRSQAFSHPHPHGHCSSLFICTHVTTHPEVQAPYARTPTYMGYFCISILTRTHTHTHTCTTTQVAALMNTLI